MFSSVRLKRCCIAWLILFLPLTAPNETDDDVKTKRDFFHFGKMVWQFVGRNPLYFTHYGNYCGLGGDGDPVDPLDQCCQVHDKCYGYVQSKAFCWSNTLMSLITEKYKYEMVNGSIVCAEDNDPCSQMGCICDRALCECLKEFIHLYNTTNRGYRLLK